MRNNKLIKKLDRELGAQISVRRYSLADMLSESYKCIYRCEEGTNMKRLAESHLADLKENPRDIERLSRQLGILKEMISLNESGQLKDEDLVAEENYDKVEPKEERRILRRSKVLEESKGNYKWGDWQTERGNPHKVKYYCSGMDLANQVIGVLYAPAGDITSYGAEIYNNSTADTIEGVEQFDSELAAMDWVESYLSASVDECNTPTKKSEGRKFRGTKNIQESTDSDDLTDEELEELAKHLESIRKERKNPQKKKDLDEAETPTRIYQLGIDLRANTDDDFEALRLEINKAIEDVVQVEVVGSMWSDTSWDPKEYGLSESKKDRVKESVEGKKYQVDIYIDGEFDRTKYFDDLKTARKWVDQFNYDGDIGDSATDPELVEESKSYKGLESFRKQSESKAFYKTFKKLDSSLREGKALTRQESIDLYKASNSALTQLSIELEHNPEFLDTFKESVSILSKDVNSLLESLTRGKAPSKATMKSLAKFSGVLLNESADSYKGEYNGAKIEITPEGPAGRTCYVDGKFFYMDGGPIDKVLADLKLNIDHPERMMDESKKLKESEKMTPDEMKKYWEKNKDNDPVLANYNSYEEWYKDSKSNGYVSDEDLDESEEGEDIIVDETPDEDFVGADEGDIEHEPSEEEEQYDQEYADGREELHQELADEFGDTEDEFVQGKLAQDAEEVAILNGEDPEELGAEEESPEDDGEITDDELAELKKHLKEMREAKKSMSEGK